MKTIQDLVARCKSNKFLTDVDGVALYYAGMFTDKILKSILGTRFEFDYALERVKELVTYHEMGILYSQGKLTADLFPAGQTAGIVLPILRQLGHYSPAERARYEANNNFIPDVTFPGIVDPSCQQGLAELIDRYGAKCPDCKGTGKYIGLIAVEPCRSCQ